MLFYALCLVLGLSMKKLTATVYIDRLHMAPCAEIANRIINLDCEVWFTYKDKKINCKSITSLFLANLYFGDKITIFFEGKDADTAKERLSKYFNDIKEMFL